MFKSFEHDHGFVEENGGTLMHDVLRFAAPLGLLGTIAEVLVLRKYLEGFLIERNGLIKKVAESDAWRRFVPEDIRAIHRDKTAMNGVR